MSARVRSQHSISRGSHGRSGSDLRLGNLCRRHLQRNLAHGLGTRHRTGGHSCESARSGAVGVVNVIHDSRVAIVVVDHRHVGDMNIGDVYVRKVIPAYGIRRCIRFIPAKGEPTHTPAASSDRDSNPPVRTAHKSHQGRCIDWTNCDHHRSGSPAPVASAINPATIVTGRESPRSVVDPGPSPWFNPNPMSIVIRSPSWSNTRGHPHRTVIRRLTPAPVFVEIFGTNHVWRNVACRGRVSSALVTNATPIVEAIWT
jgi:hypothetical protein